MISKLARGANCVLTEAIVWQIAEDCIRKMR